VDLRKIRTKKMGGRKHMWYRKILMDFVLFHTLSKEA